MNSSVFFQLLFCFFLVSVTFGLKTWLPNTNLNDKRNWNILDVPKNCDFISFAVGSGLSLFWPFRDLIVTGIKLPLSGSLSFKNAMTIHFRDKEKCEGVREVEYKRDEWKGWLDPENWVPDSKGMWKPHSQRIPCSGENVKFPSGNNFAVQLPVIMVPVGKIFLEDEEYDGDDWGDFLNTENGKSQFRSEKVSQAGWLHDVGCGKRNCTCGKFSYVFKERTYKTVPASLLHQAVCLYAKQTCGTIPCYSPVVPEGHCCGVCGAVMKIRDNSEDDGVLIKIREKVRKKMDNGGNVNYYVGRTLDGNIQVAIVSETAELGDDALALAGLIKDDLAGEHFGSLLSAKFSGMSYSGNFFNNTMGIVFGTLFAVLAFFASIYIFYIVLPEKNIITGEHPFQFARFKNSLHEAGSEEKLEIGAEEVLSCEDSDGFQNPTFSSEQVSGSALPTSNISKQEPEREDLNETELRPESAIQEYDNPTYHEMEKTKDFNIFEVKNEETVSEEKEFNEIEL